MTAPIRVRRHADGRWAVFDPRREFYGWWVSDDAPGGPPALVPGAQLRPGDGWSELLVAELPEPDPVLVSEIVDERWADYDTLRTDALKMLAAVAACEREAAP